MLRCRFCAAGYHALPLQFIECFRSIISAYERPIIHSGRLSVALILYKGLRKFATCQGIPGHHCVKTATARFQHCKMRREAIQVTIILRLLFGSLGEVGSWSDDGGRIIYPVALDDDRLLPISDYDTPPMYEMEEFVPLTDEQEAYRKITVGADEKRVRKAIGASGSGSGSDIPTTTPVIDVEGCILPNDVPSPPTDTEEMLTQRALCDVSCLEAQDIIESQSLELQELWNVFPISVLTRNCLRYGNYEACRLACFSRVEDPSISDCPRTCRRELCSGICGSQRNCFSDSFPPCGIICDRTPCGNGCGFFDGLSSRGPYPQDLNPLTLPPPTQEDLQFPLYSLDITGAAPSAFRVTDRTVVSVLARVESQPGDYSYYLLDSSLRLNLEAFICRRVSVSFAVATPSFQLSAYSAPASVEVNNTVLLPDQLDSFDTSFTPDLRAGFYREHILTVEWERPSGFELVTNYTVTVDLVSGPGCGQAGVETYQTDRDATSLTVYSSPTHRFYRQCTYIIRVQTNPLRPGDEVPRVSLSPPTEYPDPDESDVQRSCPRMFNVNTFQYDVTLSWTLNTFPAFVSAISFFRISRLTVRNGEQIGFNRERDVTAVPGQTEYSESFQYDPILQEGLRYTLSVIFVFLQNLTDVGVASDFSFVCEVEPLPPLLPSTVEDVELTEEPLFFEQVLGNERFVTVRVNFEWSLATVQSGTLMRYEATLRQRRLRPRENPMNLMITRYSAVATSGSIFENFETFETNFTLFLQIRARSDLDFNNVGNWSQPLPIQIVFQPPEVMTDINVTQFDLVLDELVYTNDGNISQIFVDVGVEWGAPDNFFGSLTLYEVTLGDEILEEDESPVIASSGDSSGDSSDLGPNRRVESFEVDATSGSFQYMTFNSNFELTLHLQMRAHNNFAPGDWSEAISMEIIIPRVPSTNILTFFQLRVGPLQHCQEWIQQSILVAEMERGIRRAIAAVIAENCNCSFAIESIAVGTITCSSTLLHQIVYRSVIQSVNADQEIGILQEWVGTSSARITISPFILAVDPSCPVRIGSLNDPPCDEPDTVCPNDFSLVTRDFRITRTARQCLRRLFGWPHILGQGCTARVGRRRPRN